MLFRLILAVPAYIVSTVVTTGWIVASFLIWLIVLITGRMPRALFDAIVAVLRYSMRLNAFLGMVTSAYPNALLGDPPEAPAPPLPSPVSTAPYETPLPPGAVPPPPLPAAEAGAMDAPERPLGRLVLSSPAKRIVVVFIVLGVIASVAQSAYYSAKRGEFILVVGIGGPPDVFGPSRARDAFFDASQSLAARVGSVQQTVGRCGTQPEPFRCAQDAERGLVSDLQRFDAAVDGIDFPDEARTKVLSVRLASSAFRTAIETLIGASSEEEYLELAGALDQEGQALDAAIVALGTTLDRLVVGG